MGTFHETCALTNLPIQEGQRAILVLFDSAELTSDCPLAIMEATYGLLGIYRGAYDGYGGVVHTLLTPDRLHAIHHTWAERLGEKGTIGFFSLESAWDRVLAWDRTRRPAPEYVAGWCEQVQKRGRKELEIGEPSDLEGYFRIITFCLRTRREPFAGLRYQGSQGECLDDQAALHEIARAELLDQAALLAIQGEELAALRKRQPAWKRKLDL